MLLELVGELSVCALFPFKGYSLLCYFLVALFSLRVILFLRYLRYCSL